VIPKRPTPLLARLAGGKSEQWARPAREGSEESRDKIPLTPKPGPTILFDNVLAGGRVSIARPGGALSLADGTIDWRFRRLKVALRIDSLGPPKGRTAPRIRHGVTDHCSSRSSYDGAPRSEMGDFFPLRAGRKGPASYWRIVALWPGSAPLAGILASRSLRQLKIHLAKDPRYWGEEANPEAKDSDDPAFRPSSLLTFSALMGSSPGHEEKPEK